jgi:transcriptional regulator with XRE-family HTH domain
MNKIEKEDWYNFMVDLKEKVKKKYGYGYQVKIADEIGLNKNRISRFFNLRNPPRLDTIFIISNLLNEDVYIKKKQRIKRKKKC